MSGLVIYCDGLCEPNPGGHACWAWMAYQDGALLVQDKGYLGEGPAWTNNVAEYIAVGKALRWAHDGGYRGITVHSDSQLVVHQANGAWECRSEALQRYLAKVQALMAATEATLVWIPRSYNEVANALSGQAYQEAVGHAVDDASRREQHMRGLPPTDKQLDLLHHLGVSQVPANRLAASELISQRLSGKGAR